MTTPRRWVPMGAAEAPASTDAPSDEYARFVKENRQPEPETPQASQPAGGQKLTLGQRVSGAVQSAMQPFGEAMAPANEAAMRTLGGQPSSTPAPAGQVGAGAGRGAVNPAAVDPSAPAPRQPAPYRSRGEALDDAVNLVEEGADISQVAASFGRIGIKREEIEQHGMQRGSQVFTPQRLTEPEIDAARAAQGKQPAGSIQPSPAPRSRTLGEIATDTGLQLKSGTYNIMGAVPQLVAPDGEVAQFFQDRAKQTDRAQSGPMRDRMAIADVAITEAGEDGFTSQLAEAASQYFSEPALAARFVVSNLPSMIPGLGAAKLAQVATLARGMTAAKAARNAALAGGAVNATLNAGGARGEAFDDIKRTLMAKGMSEQEATDAALRDSRVVAAIGGIAGAISGASGLEGVVAKSGTAAARGGLAQGVKSAGAELLGEQVEEVAPQVATNVIAGQYDGRDASKDVARTMVETAIGSGPGAALAGVGEIAGDPNRQIASEIRRSVPDVPQTPGMPAGGPSAWEIARSKGFNVEPPMPTDKPSVRRSKAVDMFTELGAMFGIPKKPMDLALQYAETVPADNLPGFFSRYAQALEKRGLVGQQIDPDVLAAMETGAPAVEPIQQGALAEEAAGLSSPEAAPAPAEEVQQQAAPVQPEPLAVATAIDAAAHEAATSPTNDRAEPTQAQKEAGNYKVGRTRVAGMDVRIENPQGSKRRGVAPDGTPWETEMRAHYGYFAGTEGADGDKLDVFIKPGTAEDWRGPVFVIDQIDPKTGQLDEHKVVMGAADEAEAEGLYRSNYDADWQGLGAITRLPLPAFKAWAKSGRLKEPLGDIASAPQLAPDRKQAPAAQAQQPVATPAAQATTQQPQDEPNQQEAQPTPATPQASQAGADSGGAGQAAAGEQGAGVSGAGSAPAAEAARLKASKRGRQQFSLDPERDTLLQALAKLGGIRRDVVGGRFGLAPEELKHTVSTGKLKAYPFRKTGGMDLDQAVTALAELGYFDGIPEEDHVRAFEEAVHGELGGTPTLSTAGRMRQASESYNANADELQAAAEEDALSQGEADAEREAIMAEAGLTDEQLSSHPDLAIEIEARPQSIADGMRAMGFTEQEIADELAKAGNPALQGREGSRAQDPEIASRQAQAPPGAGDATARPADRTRGDTRAAQADDQPGQEDQSLTLSAQSEQDLRDKAAREGEAAKAEAKARADEQQAIRQADDRRDTRARADATVDDFQLGQSADQQLSGMGDLFAAQNEPESQRDQADATKDAANTEAQRTLDVTGRASDGKPILPGDVFRTASGRMTTPYPKQKSEKFASQWLTDNAVSEAESRGDDFNGPTFKAAKPGRDGALTPADRDSMLEYLFGQQPAVLPSVLKPLSGTGKRSSTLRGNAQDSDEVRRAKADAMKALGDLADIFGKGTRLNMMPEQEQKLLPVLTRLFDAAFRLGYLKFKDAARFALDQIRSALGDDVADQITLEHLQGGYIGMSGRYKGKGAESVTAVAAVARLEDIADNSAEEGGKDVPNTSDDLEPDRTNTARGQRVLEGADGEGPGAADRGARQAGEPAGAQGRRRAGDSGVPAGGTSAARDGGDQPVRGSAGKSGPSLVPAGSDVDQRGGGFGDTGVPVETVSADATRRTAQDGLAQGLTSQAQRKAPTEFKLGDIDNIRATLPALLPGQQDDVRKAEERFSKPDGYGILFTNGTGTGKTFTGLGVVKRMALQGKENILLVAPSDKVIEDWINSGKVLGLNITKLASVKDVGKGMVITTYANLGDNQVLGDRRWDAAVLDEAHYLMASKDGELTNALRALRAVTFHPDGVSDLAAMRNRELGAKVKDLSERIKGLQKLVSADDTMDEARAAYSREIEQLDKQLAPLSEQLKEANGRVREEVLTSQGEKRPRVTFLSATPWAYVQALDWSNGYLFEFDEGRKEDRASGTGGRAYNEGSNRQQFFMQHFGYRMRYNKLTRPDAKVDVGLMERQFNAWLRQQGVLSRRALDVAADYDRRFILLESAIGTRIDEALSWVSERAYGNKDAGIEANPAYQTLSGAIGDQFDYLSRRYLLEAIKATEVIPIVRQHLAKGRKVVVFHDFKKGGGFNPFAIKKASGGQSLTPEQVDAFNAALFEFQSTFQDLINYPFERMPSPIQVFSREFPDLLLFNGDVPPKTRRENVAKFQDDAKGPGVILVQSAAGKEGISLHDTTGKHQRALINLGQPTAPTTAIQQEGRIYRTGQVTDAILRYLTTGTTWERYAFASQVATRSATVENLAAGEEARALADAFIAAYEEADTFEPGHEGEGLGGKQRDKAAYEALTEFDRAVSFYYGTQKKNAKTKAKEGADYFATPEPLGLKMVEWANVHPGDSVLEPSAGHGAIARWFPQSAERTAVEPSLELRSRLAMVFGDGKIVSGDFEAHHVVNKYDAIVMNPPFGSGGRTAVDHLAKAAEHLREGGRIVAIIPTGPAADKKFDKWFYEEDTKPVKPLTTIEYGMGPQELFRGDTIKTRASFAPQGTVSRMNAEGTGVWIKVDGKPGETMVTLQSITAHARTGPRTMTFKPAEGLHLVADLKLPQVAFERAGTNVATRVVVIEKARDGEVTPAQRNADFTSVEAVEDFFKRIRDYSLPKRAKPEPTIEEVTAPAPEEAKAEARQSAKVEKAAAQRQGAELADSAGMQLVEHVTGKGKTLKGVIRKDFSQAQAKEIDPYTFKKDGGWFIRAEHLPKMLGDAAQDEPSFSLALHDTPFFSELAAQVERSPMNAGTPGAWQQYLDALAKRGAVKADEMEWTGLREWLAMQPGKVSKADIAAYLDANGVQVDEVTLSGEEYALQDDPVVEERDDGLWAVMDPDTDEQIGGDYATQADAQAAVQEMVQRSDGAAKFKQWALPGGQNYREVLLTLPSDTPPEERNTAYYRETTQDYKSSHWDQPNVLAHIRVDERTDADGKRVLFVQEIQSDWGQEGKRKGFRGQFPAEVLRAAIKGGMTEAQARSDIERLMKDPLGNDGESTHDNWSRLIKATEGSSIDLNEVFHDRRESGAPAAPFVTKTDAWVGLAIKRVIAMAAADGFDRVEFINGQQAADLFDLSKQISYLGVRRKGDGLAVTAQRDGEVVFLRDTTREALPDLIGKEMAEKVMGDLKSSDSARYTDLDLKVGGEGMRTFYDQIVPKVAKDVLRKVGGGDVTSKTSVTEQPGNERKPAAKPIERTNVGFDITDAIRAKAAQGLPLFSRGPRDGVSGGIGGRLRGVENAISRVDLVDVIDVNLKGWRGFGLDRIVAVDHWTALPQQILDDAKKKGSHAAAVEGVVYRGKVYLVRSNLRDRAHAERVLFHEVWGHMGTRLALAGKPTEELSRLWGKLNGLAGVAKLAKKHQVGDGYTAWDRLQPYVQTVTKDQVDRRAKIVEELIAFLAQANDTSALTQFKGYLADLKSAVVALARKLGLDGLAERLDRVGAELDVLQLVRDARLAIERGTTREGQEFVLVSRQPAPAYSEASKDEAGFSLRTDEPVQVPDVIEGNPLSTTANHPDYVAAKAGDVDAAVRLALDLVTPDLVAKVRAAVGDDVIVQPVTAEEAAGRNKIPLAGAKVLAQELGATVGLDVVQGSRAHRTAMDGLGRLFASPEFIGDVVQGGRYLLLDDTLTQGGTFAALASHIQQNGGTVVGAVALTGKQYSATLRLSPELLSQVRETYSDVEPAFRAATGRGFDSLTQSEARYLAKHKSPDDVRGRIAEAGRQAGGREDGRDPQGPQGLSYDAPSYSLSAQRAGFSLPEFGRTGRFIEAIQDRYNRWKQAIAAVRQQGGEVTEANDFYAAEERYWGIVGAQLDDFKTEIRDFVKTVQADGLELTDVALYAYAKHAGERNARIAEINDAFPDGGSGMTNAQADEILAKARTDGVADALERHAAQLHRWSAGSREVLRDNGLISQEEFDAWSSGYEHYVPLRGKPGQAQARGMGTGQGFDIRGKESFRALGRRSMATNIVEHILQDRTKALIRAGKNEVLRRFTRFVLDNPDPALWEVNAVKRQRRLVDTPMGEQVIEFEELNDSKAETVAVKDGGQTIFIHVKDEELLKQLKNLQDEARLPVVVEALQWANRLLSRMYTSLNPVFTVLNGARDVTAGAVNMLGVAGPSGAGRMLRNLPDAYREAFNAEVKGRPSGLYSEYRTTGGKTGFMDFKDIEGYGKELAEIAAESQTWGSVLTTEGGWDKAVATWRRSRGSARRLLERIEDINGAVENATRFAAYKAARQEGKSIAEAASIAKNITVNFNRKGSMTPVMSSFFLFFNPAVQGTARMLQALASREVQVAMGTAMVGLFGLALANASMGGDDEDDGATYWDKIPDEVKDRNLVIMLPPGVDVGDRVGEHGRYIKIPMPYGYNTFAVIAATAADVLRNQFNPTAGVTPTKGAARVFKSFVGSWMPVSDVAPSLDNPKGAALAFVPDALDPIMEPVLNVNSFGRAMYPEGMGYDKQPDSEKVFAGQKGGWAHGAARNLNELTGGSQYHEGAISVTPATVNNLVRGYGGGVATFILSLADMTASQGISRDTPDWYRAPFVRQLYGSVDMVQDQALAYDRLHDIEAATVPLDRAIKAGDRRAAAAIAEDAGGLAKLGPVAREARQQLTNIRKHEVRVIESQKLTDAEKNASLKQWDRERQKVYDRVNRAWARSVEDDARHQPE